MKIMPISYSHRNSVNYEKNSHPAFGRLIISKEAQKALPRCNFDGLSRLRLAAKRLEHTLNWDLKVLKLSPSNNTLGGSYQVQNRLGNKAYRDCFAPTPIDPSREVVNTPNFFMKTIDAETGKMTQVHLRFDSVRDARDAYNIMDTEKNLERATGLTLHLEAESEVGKKGLSYKKAFLASVKNAHEYMINKLIEKCGE